MIAETQIYKELQPGFSLCDGKYTIEKKIGEGGFGITYKAIQSGLNRTVCIKEYFREGKCYRNTHSRTVYAQGTSEEVYEKYRQAFVKEAKVLASLHHPNIVEIIDVFDENNTSYMVMTYIEGKSLQSIVEARGKLPYPETVNYIAQITNAVGYIHEHHILHRDIKPDNIMITADYKAILIDFGSAREFEQDKTQVHTSMLTHGYAPTEQYTANSRKGSYTDIYAIGATMYFVLTGQVPTEAAARLTEPMAAPKDLTPDIPDEANRTILKAMQLKAENRHQTVQEFMDDLRNIRPSVLVDETIGSSTSTKKLRKILIVAGGVIIALLCFLVFRPKKIVKADNSYKDYKTYDFTGMNAYPMIKVSGGTFVMGSSESGDEDCPPHNVTVSDFYIGQFEVSQELWVSIMGNNPSAYQPKERRDSLPVENVSYEDIQLFIKQLNNKTSKSFSLPTEAQWEYAARGGRNSSGNKFSGVKYPNEIWFDKDHPFHIRFAPSINELGIYQMSGNVAEWCLDYYKSDYYDMSNDSIDPLCDQKGKYHVIRGGSFYDNSPECLTVYYREGDNSAREYIGFRMVLNKE
ncbi:MAG: SUMF1/EgtB/PvdO family nonheme iron enzyme [Prevotellaceae bacterium]|nr:SUMF1/EgtB/PvdO family nonheme iron enzyme [Candidatus Colivivens equi]